MKKSPLSLALSVGLLFAMASCSDDHQFESVNDGSVTFNISVPDAVMSRANFGDGTTAQNNVQYYVYDQANPATANPVLTGKVTMTGLKGTVMVTTGHVGSGKTVILGHF